MTASKTARLGLMNPAGSDAFVTVDFADSFNILDQNPGILTVLNAAARPTNYTAAQHGSVVYQQDLNILWGWNQPSSGSAGSWRRIGNVGLLGTSASSGLVTTTATTPTAGAQVAALTLSIPGGRPLMVKIDWDVLGNTYNKAVVSYWEQNSLLLSRVFPGSLPPAASAGSWMFATSIPSAAFTLNAKVTVASYNAAPSNGGGTTQASGASITIWEL